MIRGAIALWGLMVAPVLADPICNTGTFEDVRYTACVIDPAAASIRLYHQTLGGNLIGSFDNLAGLVEREGGTLKLAMNGGMYHPDRRPVGYYVENGNETAGLVLREGPGNFGLLPNGVFCMAGPSASVTESRAFSIRDMDCDFATQSGPLMVEQGALHPRFIPDSTSEFIRNGVGVRPDGNVVFAISDDPVNFHRFARLFRDRLGTPDALYLDGKVSKLYAPSLGRAGPGLPMGPMLAVVD